MAGACRPPVHFPDKDGVPPPLRLLQVRAEADILEAAAGTVPDGRAPDFHGRRPVGIVMRHPAR